MSKHFPTFKRHWDKHGHKLPDSLFQPGASLWIIVGALIGFFGATGTMGIWVVRIFTSEIAATIFVPSIIIISVGAGMAFGIALHRTWDHHRSAGDGESKPRDKT